MPRSEIRRPSAAPKCKVDNYGLARKNSLIGIAQRLSARSDDLREEKRTIWLTSEFERIGLERSHIQELGIDIHHFFDPDWDRTPRGKHQEDHPIPSRAIEQDLEAVTNTAQQVQPLSSLECFKKSKEPEVHHGILYSSKNKQLEKLRSNENIRLISSQELKDRISISKRNLPLIKNKIVKGNESNKISRRTTNKNSKLVLRANNRPKSSKKSPRKIVDASVSEKENKKTQVRENVNKTSAVQATKEEKSIKLIKKQVPNELSNSLVEMESFSRANSLMKPPEGLLQLLIKTFTCDNNALIRENSIKLKEHMVKFTSVEHFRKLTENIETLNLEKLQIIIQFLDRNLRCQNIYDTTKEMGNSQLINAGNTVELFRGKVYQITAQIERKFISMIIIIHESAIKTMNFYNLINCQDASTLIISFNQMEYLEFNIQYGIIGILNQMNRINIFDNFNNFQGASTFIISFNQMEYLKFSLNYGIIDILKQISRMNVFDNFNNCPDASTLIISFNQMEYLKFNIQYGIIGILKEMIQRNNLVELIASPKIKNISNLIKSIIEHNTTLNINELLKLLKIIRNQKKKMKLLRKVANKFNKDKTQIAIVKGLRKPNPFASFKKYWMLREQLYFREFLYLPRFSESTRRGLRRIPHAKLIISNSNPIFHRIVLRRIAQPSPKSAHFCPYPRFIRRIELDLRKPFLPFESSPTSKFEEFQEVLVSFYAVILIPLIVLIIATTPELVSFIETFREYIRRNYNLKLYFPKLAIFVRRLFDLLTLNI